MFQLVISGEGDDFILDSLDLNHDLQVEATEQDTQTYAHSKNLVNSGPATYLPDRAKQCLQQDSRGSIGKGKGSWVWGGKGSWELE